MRGGKSWKSERDRTDDGQAGRGTNWKLEGTKGRGGGRETMGNQRKKGKIARPAGNEPTPTQAELPEGGGKRNHSRLKALFLTWQQPLTI